MVVLADGSEADGQAAELAEVMLYAETLVQLGEPMATGAVMPPTSGTTPATATPASGDAATTSSISDATATSVRLPAAAAAAGAGAAAGTSAAPRRQRRERSRQTGPDSYSSMEAALLMSLLPHERWGFHYIRDEDNGEGDAECRVCMIDYEPDDEIVRLPCMHYAHIRCVEQWLIRSPMCPICRTNVREAMQAS